MTKKEQAEFCTEAEKKERDFFLSYKIYHPDITYHEFTPLSCAYDVIFISAGTKYCAEIKVRKDNNLNYFLKYGPYLEEKKLDGMTSENIETLPMMYFNFALGGCSLYILTDKQDYVWAQELLPKSNWDKTKVHKSATKLFNPAEKFLYNLKQK